MVVDWIYFVVGMGGTLQSGNVHGCQMKTGTVRRMEQFELQLNYLNDPYRQTCKVCGRKDKFNFNVQNETWEAVVPPMFQNNVVCLSCFDGFAVMRNIDYLIDSLFFAGEQKVFKCYDL